MNDITAGRQKMKRYVSVFLCISLFALMLAFPKAVFNGASEGLLLWFQIIFPTLFPFLLIIEPAFDDRQFSLHIPRHRAPLTVPFPGIGKRQFRSPCGLSLRISYGCENDCGHGLRGKDKP